MVGEVVCGRYQLEELLGSGGMSSVYRAHDSLLERDVALKILHERHTEDEEYVERFRREARAVAQLSHPNIVTVIDRGEDEGRQFIVFEYVDGQTLKDVVGSGPLDVRHALAVTIAIARGLAFAHAHGIVHRDVKPQNVLVNDDGEPKVTDFGIARSVELEGVTKSGTVLGTSNYIAPEQATGQAVDERTDVYALGVVLFELLTGELPFAGESFVAVAMQHVHEPPPSVRERRADIPPRVARAVERALEKEPRDRFASMDEFAHELESCLRALDPDANETQTLVAPPPRSGGKRAVARRSSVLPFVLVAIGAVLLALAIAGVLIARDGETNAPEPAGAAKEGTTVKVVGAGSFDPPPGDGEEHSDRAGEATDADLTTYWTTERYESFTKPGVGLVLDARRPATISELTITTDTPGFTVLIRSGPSPDQARAVSTPKSVNGTTRIPVSSGAQRYYVIWITNLGPNQAVHLNEISAG